VALRCWVIRAEPGTDAVSDRAGPRPALPFDNLEVRNRNRILQDLARAACKVGSTGMRNDRSYRVGPNTTRFDVTCYILCCCLKTRSRWHYRKASRGSARVPPAACCSTLRAHNRSPRAPVNMTSPSLIYHVHAMRAVSLRLCVFLMHDDPISTRRQATLAQGTVVPHRGACVRRTARGAMACTVMAPLLCWPCRDRLSLKRHENSEQKDSHVQVMLPTVDGSGAVSFRRALSRLSTT
jgi:hypothetical protein